MSAEDKVQNYRAWRDQLSRSSFINCAAHDALAVLADAAIEALEAANERLKCCGNCGMPDMENTIGDVILCPETNKGLDGTETRHHVPCWFTPSRWTAREDG